MALSSSTSPAIPLAHDADPAGLELNEGDRDIEADDNISDNDSTYQSLYSNGSTSLNESVKDYLYQHGRRYHSQSVGGNYILPNDELESARLDMAHEIFRMTIGDKSYLAPIEPEKIHQVLDIGTGTGIWAIDFADEFPNAQVLGNDISPIQPDFVPPNVKFEVDDIEKDWVHATKFDFIFGRYLMSAICDWPKLVKNAYDHLNPGGWVEFQDYDIMLRGDTSGDNDLLSVQWATHHVDAARQIGREPSPGPRLEHWVKQAGFVNVRHHKFKIPVGDWPKDAKMKLIGAWMLENTLSGLGGFSLRLFCDVLRWSEDEVHVFLAGVRKQLPQRQFRWYWNWHVVYGQKPE